MSVSEYDRAHMGEIMMGEGDWFSAHLFRLMHRCDPTNFAKLQQVYPEHAQVYLDWVMDS
jgi:hypothetical protein